MWCKVLVFTQHQIMIHVNQESTDFDLKFSCLQELERWTRGTFSF